MKKKYVIIIAILAVVIVGLIVALVVTNLPKKEKIRLLNIAYDYEEKYKISNNT